MYEFSCPGPVNLFAKVSAGAVEVVAEPRDTATVEVLPWDASGAAQDAAERTRVELHADRLVVESPDAGIGFLLRRTARVNVRVRVPIDSHLQAKVASADLRGQGRYASASIVTASGNIAVAHVTGESTIKSASGRVLIEQADGSVSASAASGDVTVTHVGGDFAASTASGDVTVADARSSVKIGTASGAARVGAVQQGSVTMKSASGDLTVGVRQGTSAWLDLHTISGHTRSDLAVNDAPPAGGAAGLTVRLRSASGDIDVHRVNASAGGDTPPVASTLPLPVE